MNAPSPHPSPESFRRVADYVQSFRTRDRKLHPTAAPEDLRRAFCVALPEHPTDPSAVIEQLITAAEPGLVGNTDPSFHAWVMGSSDMTGVLADMLTSVWGQNAAIFQTSPAAAIAEEAVATWLLELLDLPRQSSVGFVTGATMASFVGLAAARSEVLRRVGHDYERDGLQTAPLVHIYLSDDAHICNEAALRYLGFGEANLVRIRSDAKGLMQPEALAIAMSLTQGPKIIIGQAGHINSGGFEDFHAISDLARRHRAWLHIDGAFGLWARILPEKDALTRGLDLADSWSVDGHKWLQIPYDSGFAIIKDAQAHRRAMDAAAGYLNVSPDDGRNPNEYNPELSRRARGFAAWAVLLARGKSGVRDLVRRHCDTAQRTAQKLSDIPGLNIDASPDLNQLVLRLTRSPGDPPDLAEKLAARINKTNSVFVKPAKWKGDTVLRLSFISNCTDAAQADLLAETIRSAWRDLRKISA
ncbi:MAG: pyridoxal-dependent decarboxylase [Pseudomonadota bacterium]